MEFLYLAIVFIVAIVGFSVLKRPLYECMLAAFLVLVACTGTWASFGEYIWDAITEPSLYVIIVFVISASLLAKTTVIDDCIAIILSIFGRLRGGAGYVAIIASTYMGSLSGSGPGNVATTGVFTIPAMKKSGFPSHLAANVEAHTSTMGNMIPPAGMIAVAFAALDKLYPDTYTMSQYWMILWGIALWFILQRILTLYFLCRYYKVEAMKKEDIPSLRESLRHGWRAIFLPIIVFLPFFLTSKFDAFFVERLGSGASSFNSSILLIIPSLIVICGIFLSGRETIKKVTPKYIYQEICTGMAKVVPTSALVMFAYFVSNVFEKINVEVAIGEYIASMNLPLIGLAFIVPLFTTVMGMLIPGSTQVKIFGGIIISIFAAAGGNPMLAAGMLPCICGATHGVTPPYCACVYTAMGIAEAELKPTLKENMVWITIHYLLSVAVILGFIPVFGLK
ncbi:MAG: TRAP transporter large permease subunit [Clostridia bacterium]|nr:TRAP transporter large permease subunit [Clostridia bacterium]MBR6523974.1 TRAP transporter large permease subunit [Clostridia bacterium]